MFRRCATTGGLLLALAAATFAAEPPERDPMQPFVKTGAPGVLGADPPRFSLTAVVISPTRRVAILNGKPYLLAGVVDGAEIVAIEHDAVRLRDGGKDIVISLGPPHSGRPSAQGEELP